MKPCGLRMLPANQPQPLQLPNNSCPRRLSVRPPVSLTPQERSEVRSTNQVSIDHLCGALNMHPDLRHDFIDYINLEPKPTAAGNTCDNPTAAPLTRRARELHYHSNTEHRKALSRQSNPFLAPS
jgi:hypothetical protein